MPDDQNRRAPIQRAMAIAVQMRHVRFELIGESQQPFARKPHVAPWIFHPLQFEIAFADAQVGDGPDLFALSRRERRAHCG